MTEPVSLTCPMCATTPVMVFRDSQALCTNRECRVVLWDPTHPQDDLLNKAIIVDWEGE